MQHLLLRSLQLLFFIGSASFPNLVIATQTNINVSIVAEEFYPYQYQRDGEAKGVAVEIVKHIFASNQLTAKIQFYPWPRALRIAEAAPNTLILSITKSPKRQPKFYWIGMIDSHELYLWVNKVRWGNHTFSDEQLQKLTIGVPRDGYQHQFLKAHPLLANNAFSVVNTKEQSLSMLAMNRIDAVSGDPKLLSSRMRNIGLSPDLLLPVKHFPGNNTELYIAMSKNSNPELVDKLKRTFAAFAKTNKFQQLINDY